MPSFKDLTGIVFSRLTVLERAESIKGASRWRCLCECGSIVIVRANALQMGNTRSCGCLFRETRVGGYGKTHGLSNTPEYISWKAMQRRCTDPQYHAFKHYGGRGISVCQFLQQDPRHLVETIGLRPPSKTVDRIDADLCYSCGHCAECLQKDWPMNLRWTTQVEQLKNRRDKKCLHAV